MTNEAQQQSIGDLKKLLLRINYGLIIAGIILIAVPAIGTWWVSRQIPVVNTVEVENLRIVGETELCPGDPLILEYDFHAKGAGVLVRDFSLWLITPPKTMIYSTSRRFILDGPTDQYLRETWTLPDTYFNYETEQMEPIEAGRYRRYMAISSPSRSSVIAIASVEFIVREGCRRIDAKRQQDSLGIAIA